MSRKTLNRGPSAVALEWDESEEPFKPEHHQRKKPLVTPESKTGKEWMTTKRKKKPEILAKNSYSSEEKAQRKISSSDKKRANAAKSKSKRQDSETEDEAQKKKSKSRKMPALFEEEARQGDVKQCEKDVIGFEMHLFKKKKLRFGPGGDHSVKNPKQAIAIALNIAKKKCQSAQNK
jgi:Family of unknown function (DUF6496)